MHDPYWSYNTTTTTTAHLLYDVPSLYLLSAAHQLLHVMSLIAPSRFCHVLPLRVVPSVYGKLQFFPFFDTRYVRILYGFTVFLPIQSSLCRLQKNHNIPQVMVKVHTNSSNYVIGTSYWYQIRDRDLSSTFSEDNLS